MAVMVTTLVENQTEAGYDQMLRQLGDLLRTAPGFVLHGAHRAVDGEWRVIEVWNSKPEADHFFATQVAPNLSPGIRPKRTVAALHSLLMTA